MSLPDELELIHFDNEPTVSKKEQQKESKKQGKRSKATNSKKTSINTNVPSDPSLGTGQTRRYGKRRNRDSKLHSDLWETYYSNNDNGNVATDNIECIRGFLLKRRKFPLKGFHKRYFVLQNGILTYGRSQAQLEKGKCLGQIDMGYSVMSMQAERLRIDIDAGDQSFVYHLKAWDASHFAAWSSRLHQHSMFRRRQLSETLPHMQHGQEQMDIGHISPLNNWITGSKESTEEMRKALEAVQEGLESLSVYVTGVDTTSGGDNISQRSDHNCPSTSEVFHPQVQQLSQQSMTPSRSINDMSSPTVTITADTPKKKRFSKLRIRGGGKGSSDRPKSPVVFQDATHQPIDRSSSELSRSWSNLSEPRMESAIVYDDFVVTAHQVYSQLVEIINKLEKERESLQDMLEREAAMRVQQKIMMAGLKLSLSKSQAHNNELRESLAKIRSIATISEATHVPDMSINLGRSQRGTSLLSKQPSSMHTSLNRFESFMSIPSSFSTTGEKFFDAPDEFMLPGGESSEDEMNSEDDDDDEEYDEDDDNDSEGEERSSQLPFLSPSPHHNPSAQAMSSMNTAKHSTERDENIMHQMVIAERRKTLPSPEVASGDIGLWTILRKNIGKDLSKVSMPVSLNEPLGALQRLCEELHYSELLDKAATLSDPCDRMLYVAAFAVSGYSSFVHRAKYKPFNPILGETYECIREDRGFKYISEQVSHHPPIAACHCESPNFVLWQDARIKNKFWGKSMEVFPLGTVNLDIPKHDDHYTWNKATACIHNLLSGTRWVENYGEVLIENGSKCCCKLIFSRARYWSSKRHEVSGTIYNDEGQPVRHLFGNWTEVLYCGDADNKECIWRTETLPDYSDHYYGFTQYAIELNELTDDLTEQLPICDTRFRPDQRLLENGKLDEAQGEKLRIEQLQRDAKTERDKQGVQWIPNFFKNEIKEDNETWVYKGNYWSQREKKFNDVSLPKLW